MKEVTINSEQVFSGKVIDLFVDTVEIREGKTATREIVKHKGAVCGICVTKDKKLVFVKQYRKAVDDFLIEIPAGKLESKEVPKEAIEREVREETGYLVESMKYVVKFYTSPGFSNELGYLYFINLGEKGPTDFDEDEDIEILEYTLEEAQKMVLEGHIIDAKTILGISLYNDFINNN